MIKRAILVKKINKHCGHLGKQNRDVGDCLVFDLWRVSIRKVVTGNVYSAKVNFVKVWCKEKMNENPGWSQNDTEKRVLHDFFRTVHECNILSQRTITSLVLNQSSGLSRILNRKLSIPTSRLSYLFQINLDGPFQFILWDNS